MSRFVSQAREFLALRHYTASSRTARVALGIAVSIAIHVAAWLAIDVAPPAAARTRATLTASLVPRPQNPRELTFVLPPLLVDAYEQPAIEMLPAEEAQPVPPQGALELTQSSSDQPEDSRESNSPHILLTQPDAVFYTATEVDRGAFGINDIKPTYPEEAHFRGIEGVVELRIYIDEVGFVRDIKVDFAAPPGFFEEAAIAAFRSAKFTPAYKNDRPVKSQKRIRVAFDLTEGNQN